MESSGKMQRLIGKILLLALLGLTGWAVWAHITNPFVSALSLKKDTKLSAAILTQPGMVFSFNPAERKVTLNTIKRKKLPKNLRENAKDLLNQAHIPVNHLRYYMPKTIKRDAFWENFKDKLDHWRYNPLIVPAFAWEYLSALHDKRTNLSPAEFALFSLALTRLEITDFNVRHTSLLSKNKKSSRKRVAKQYALPSVPDLAPLTLKDGALTLEILNASGKSGVAAELTQYLREQNEKGLLLVDVLLIDNYPGEHQPHTHIVNFTGRLNQVKQLSKIMGLNNEIVSEKTETAMTNARIIIGKDYRKPL